jgi:hypothetical protein
VTGTGREPWPEADVGNDVAGFRASAGGATARFAAAQAAIIRSLVSQVAELVGGEAMLPAPAATAGPAAAGDDQATLLAMAAQFSVAEAAQLPDDPILARLLPDVYADDAKASGEFGLRSGKVAAAQTVLDTLPASGGRVRLSGPEAQAWLRAINDVRLSLGVVLGVTDDFDDTVRNLADDDPRAAYIGVYQWLAYLQESLVEALL